MRSKQHLNYKYKCFNGCRAVSDVRQKWNTGQSWGCCWNNFWGLKAKTDRRGVKLHPVWKQDSLYWYPLELSEDTALLCRGLIPSAPVMQWPVHACSNISALPGSDFFLLRLSPAQLACMSLRTEKARSNLSCECVFTESRGGLDTSERSGCEITAEARKEQKYWSILLVCVYFFFSLFCDVLGGLSSLDLKQLLSWINVRRLKVWRSLVKRIIIVSSRTWWFYSLWIGFQYGFSDTTASVMRRWLMLVLSGSTKPVLIFIDFPVIWPRRMSDQLHSRGVRRNNIF